MKIDFLRDKEKLIPMLKNTALIILGTFILAFGIGMFIFPFELTEDFVRTMAHFSEFACLSFFMNNLFVAYKEKLTPVFACALSFFYAITDEIHQIFVPGRACQFLDMMVDLAGILSGFIVYAVIYILVRKTIKKFGMRNA